MKFTRRTYRKAYLHHLDECVCRLLRSNPEHLGNYMALRAQATRARRLALLIKLRAHREGNPAWVR